MTAAVPVSTLDADPAEAFFSSARLVEPSADRHAHCEPCYQVGAATAAIALLTHRGREGHGNVFLHLRDPAPHGALESRRCLALHLQDRSRSAVLHGLHATEREVHGQAVTFGLRQAHRKLLDVCHGGALCQNQIWRCHGRSSLGRRRLGRRRLGRRGLHDTMLGMFQSGIFGLVLFLKFSEQAWRSFCLETGLPKLQRTL